MKGKHGLCCVGLILLLMSGGGTLAQEEVSVKGRLKWVSGDELSGQWLGMEAGWLKWKADELEEAVRVWLPRTVGFEVDRVNLPQPMQGKWTMTGADGSFLGCETWSLEEGAWKAKTAHAGAVSLKAESVREWRRSGKTGALLYAGPAGESMFNHDNPGEMVGQRWACAEGGVLSTSSIDQSMSLPLALPEKMRMDFWLRSKGGMPQFRWKIRHSGRQLEVESWMEELVGRGEGMPARFATLFEPEIMLSVCVDFTAKQALAYDVMGKEVGRWKVRGEKSRVVSGGAPGGLFGALAGALAKGLSRPPSASRNQKEIEIEEGLVLMNMGGHLSLERLLIREWDGKPPMVRPQDGPFVETLAGEVFVGKVNQVSEGTVQMAGVKVPLEEVAWVRTAALKQGAKIPVKSASPIEEELVMQFNDGSFLKGKGLAADAVGMQVQTIFHEQAWAVSLAGVRHLGWVMPEPSAGPPIRQVEYLDGWERGKVVTRGTWEPGDGAVPRWRLDGADKAVRINGEGPWSLTRAWAGRETWVKALPGLAHLESGELVPAEVEAWTEKEVVLRSLISAEGAVARLPTENVRALELAGEGLKSRGFEDEGWVVLRGGDKGVKVEKAAGKVTLEPGAAFGHGSFLQGTQLSFMLSSRQSYGALRVRLFCDGLQEKSAHLSLLVMRSGSTVYCGIEDPKRPGQIRGNTHRVPIEYEKPFELALKWTGTKLEAWINSSVAMTHAVTEATKSGVGIVMEPTSVWGNAMQDQVITNLALTATPGARARPSLEVESREWALQVPRRLADTPPRHLVLARNGDVLRGTVEGVNSRLVTLRSGLEVMEVPRERVALMVLPKSAGEQPRAKLEAVDKSLWWVETAGGGKVRLKVTSLGPQWVKGESPLLGRCRIPADQVVAISAEAEAKAAAKGVFSDWQFTLAPTPEIPTAAEGAAAELKDKPAPGFDLERVAGGRFKLEEAKGKVVVLDFWATWCGPCLKAMPEIMTALKDLPQDQVRLVGVNQGQAKAEVAAFLQTRGWDLEVVLDLDQKVGGLFGVKGIPHTVVVGPDGKVAWVSTGYSATMAKELTEVVRKLLP
jgi:thiol-disulfide isomerase/thioredoxin